MAFLGFIIVVCTFWFMVSLNKAIIKADRNVNPTGTAAATWGTGGYCIQVYDGDTVKVRLEGRNVVIRLYGMDAPEEAHGGKPPQAWAKESTAYLAGRILNAWVTVVMVEEDMYKRMVGRIYVGEEDMSLTMINMGMAEAYRQYLAEPYTTQYCTAETIARNNKVGLWSQHRAMSPSDYRHML